MFDTMDSVNRGSRTIFVSIPSYRDSECPLTLKDLFLKSAEPEKVHVGICLQHNLQNENDLKTFKLLQALPQELHLRQEQIRVKELDWKEARGPCLARYWTQKLFRDEAYYLQLDSHTRFVEEWDEKLIKQLEKCGRDDTLSSSYSYDCDFESICKSKKNILTSYPVGYDFASGQLNDERRPTVVVADRFSSQDGMLRLKGKLLCRQFPRPIRGFFWVAGFSFSSSLVIREVPYDPHLPFLFFGEEQLMNVRLWTHGWQFFAPGETILFHLWTRSYRPTFREVEHPMRNELERQAIGRVRTILGLVDRTSDAPEPEPESYSLGKERTVLSFEQFVGINMKTQTIEPRAKFGGITRELFADYALEKLLEQLTQQQQ